MNSKQEGFTGEICQTKCNELETAATIAEFQSICCPTDISEQEPPVRIWGTTTAVLLLSLLLPTLQVPRQELLAGTMLRERCPRIWKRTDVQQIHIIRPWQNRWKERNRGKYSTAHTSRPRDVPEQIQRKKLLHTANRDPHLEQYYKKDCLCQSQPLETSLG